MALSREKRQSIAAVERIGEAIQKVREAKKDTPAKVDLVSLAKDLAERREQVLSEDK